MENSANLLSADFGVIGAGSGGLSFAAGAAQMGASVILVEKDKMGGDCLNTGCVPSKALLAASKFGQQIKDAVRFGWSEYEATVDYKKVHKHIHDVIKSIEPNDSVERFEGLGVKVVSAEAKFIDKSTITAGGCNITATRFIIATGSYPFVPPIAGLDTVKYYTNETIFDLTQLPEHLVVIGGGPIGVELAQAFKNLGSKVTILEALIALPKDEPKLTKILKARLQKQGVNINEQININSVQGADNEQIAISYSDNGGKTIDIKATHVLVATGRRPNIDNLNLDAANVYAKPQGIIVNKSLKTSNRRIYAIGDCTGGLQFTHVAGYHAGLIIRNSIFKLRTKVNIQAIPWVTYTEPELANVGLIESQAIESKISHSVLEMPFSDSDRAQAEGAIDGMIKAIICPRGYVLGVSILGHNAGELIYPWVIAINNKLKVSAIAGSIAPYPTLNDISKRIAGSFYTPKIFGPFMRKVVKILMKITY